MFEFVLVVCKLKLQFYNVCGLHSLSAFYQIVGNSLALIQRFESLALDSGEMNEYVLSVLTSDETITFFSIEPLNSALVHLKYLHTY